MKNQPKPARVFHFDLYGRREAKYDFLNTESIESIPWKELDCPEPYHFFVPKDFGLEKEYSMGMKVDKLFIANSNGIETKCDSLSIHFFKADLFKVLDDFRNEEISYLKTKYKEKEESSGWNFSDAKKSIISDQFFFNKIHYRPFDFRETIITKNSGGFIGRSRFEVMRHLLRPNIALIVPRQTNQDYRHSFITNSIVEGNITASAKLFGTGCVFPLYTYPEIIEQQTIEDKDARRPNLNLQIVEHFSERLALKFAPEKIDHLGVFAPIDLLDYIYAVLHSPTYREKYKEFLKIDFPRVPYPKDAATFWQLVALGGEMRQIHLLESPAVNKYITQYPVGGSNVVEKVRYENGNVYINDAQYFANVPQVAWDFYIGGYQPAQKWLKDRKGRKLEFDDVLHYQKIIVALTETDRIMQEINKIEIE